MTSWMERAVCRRVDPEVFFPIAAEGPELEVQERIAKSVCGGCPVRAECLVWAIEALPYGIAGGLSEDERARLRAMSPSRRRTPRTPDVAPVRASRAEVRAAGKAAIRAGCGVAAAARRFGVTVRTATRWSRQVRAERTSTNQCPGVGEGSAGGNRAPLGSPTCAAPWQGHEQRKEHEGR